MKRREMGHFANLRDGGNLDDAHNGIPFLILVALAFALAALCFALDPLPKVVATIHQAVQAR